MSIAIRFRTDVTPGRGPVPANVPGEFVVYLGTDDVAERLDVATAQLLLTWIEWVEAEVWGYPSLLEGLYRLRGAVMVAAVVGED